MAITSKATVEMAFFPGPAKLPADWARSGHVPADRWIAAFPPELLPGVAMVKAHCMLPGDAQRILATIDRGMRDRDSFVAELEARVVTIELRAADLTEEEDMGVGFALAREPSRGCEAVSRNEAKKAFQDWQAGAWRKQIRVLPRS